MFFCHSRLFMSFPPHMSFPRKRESSALWKLYYIYIFTYLQILFTSLQMSFPRKRESIPYLQEEQSSMLFPPYMSFPPHMSFQSRLLSSFYMLSPPHMSFPRKRESSRLWKVIIFTLWQVEEMVHFILVLQMI